MFSLTNLKARKFIGSEAVDNDLDVMVLVQLGIKLRDELIRKKLAKPFHVSFGGRA
jgi:hypothetical protein